MAIKNVITDGIGASPGGIEPFLLNGLTTRQIALDITDTEAIQLPIDFQYAGKPQGDGPLSLRGLTRSAAARRLGKMLKF